MTNRPIRDNLNAELLCSDQRAYIGNSIFRFHEKNSAVIVEYGVRNRTDRVLKRIISLGLDRNGKTMLERNFNLFINIKNKFRF